MAPDSPIREQALRYFAVLERNNSWTFRQKKFVVQRLVELSEHFRKQGSGASERGSPFAPLFAAATDGKKGGGAQLAPKLLEIKHDSPAPIEKLPAGY